MRTAIHKRTNSHLHYSPKHFLTGSSKRKLKKMYYGSVQNVKHHPYQSIGLFVLFLSLISGILFFYRMKR